MNLKWNNKKIKILFICFIFFSGSIKFWIYKLKSLTVIFHIFEIYKCTLFILITSKILKISKNLKHQSPYTISNLFVISFIFQLNHLKWSKWFLYLSPKTFANYINTSGEKKKIITDIVLNRFSCKFKESYFIVFVCHFWRNCGL